MMIQTEEIKLDIPRSSRYVSIPRAAIEHIGARINLTREQVDDLKLAIGEACSNAVKFGDPDSTNIQVVYRVQPDRLEIEVHNSGEPFEWKRCAPVTPTLEDITEGGLGLFLIERLVDQLTIDSDSGDTSVTMTKLLNHG